MSYDNQVVCKLCGKSFGQLTSSHLKSVHGIDVFEYRRRFPAVLETEFLRITVAVQKRDENYQEHREEVCERAKQRYQDKKEEILEKGRQCYEANRDERLTYARERYQERTEELKAVSARSYLKHHAKRLAYQNRYYQEHLEQVRAASRQRFELHHKECLEYMRRWALVNKTKLQEKRLMYNETHRDEIHAYMHDYVREHPEVSQRYRRRRRAWLAEAEGNFTPEEFRLKCEAYDNRCFYCDCEEVLVADHTTPLSRGGSDNIENIVPSCADCNNRKHTMTYDEFVETLDVENKMRLLIWDYLELHPEMLEIESKEVV